MFDGRWRAGVDRRTQPLGSALHRIGLTANELTAAGIVAALAAAWLVAAGHLVPGMLVLVAAALPDLLDGPLAKAAGTAGRRGAFFDSVADRFTDAVVLGGTAWYLGSVHGAHATLLPLAALAAANLVSYVRAKAESLGFDGRGGVMERAERIIVLCVGLLFSVLLVPALWLILAGSLLTAGQRFVKVWRQTDRRAPIPVQSRWTVAAVEARWRSRLAAREAARESARLERSERVAARRSRRQARKPRLAGRYRGAGTRP